jgi:hypothetical protein
MDTANKYISSTEQIYGFLNYEQLLARAVDRCLYARSKANSATASEYYSAVQALYISLVDLRGKPMRTEIEKIYHKTLDDPNVPQVTARYDNLFMAITDELARSKMLFRSVMVEVGREQV